MIIGHPGTVTPELRKTREKATKQQASPNAIDAFENYEIKSTTPTSSTSGVQTFKITHDDVVMGANSVYGSHFDQQQNFRLSGGGLLFSVNGQGITSSPQIMSAGLL
jgi:hypothetical protein